MSYLFCNKLCQLHISCGQSAKFLDDRMPGKEMCPQDINYIPSNCNYVHYNHVTTIKIFIQTIMTCFGLLWANING
jgi:hypothetical protein